MGKPVICNHCPVSAWVDSDEFAAHMADHERGYCAHESLDEPGRRCHRKAGHDGGHSEFGRDPEATRPAYRSTHDSLVLMREALGETFTAVGIVQWLWTPRVEWDGLTPLEMIAIDRLEDVVKAAETFAWRKSG